MKIAEIKSVDNKTSMVTKNFLDIFHKGQTFSK